MNDPKKNTVNKNKLYFKKSRKKYDHAGMLFFLKIFI